jgi:hypothetical protein
MRKDMHVWLYITLPGAIREGKASDGQLRKEVDQSWQDGGGETARRADNSNMTRLANRHGSIDIL